uniref:DUF2263 domain-containing protein n=1 Tax=Macrostomum lignano TaxID=282301 RepID=A0A1I8FF08_9PLAT
LPAAVQAPGQQRSPRSAAGASPAAAAVLDASARIRRRSWRRALRLAGRAAQPDDLHAATCSCGRRLNGGFNRRETRGQIGLAGFPGGGAGSGEECRDEATGKLVPGGRQLRQLRIASCRRRCTPAPCWTFRTRLTVGAAADYWLSANSVRKDFEVAKLKYRIPPVFFGSQSSKLPAAHTQALEQAIPAFSFDCARAAICSHPTRY